MEELQDAIEDAQYIMAMHDDIPKPTEAWKKPTTEQMKTYQNKVALESKGNIDAAYICSGCLGFYMVTLKHDWRHFVSIVSFPIYMLIVVLCYHYIVPFVLQGHPRSYLKRVHLGCCPISSK